MRGSGILLHISSLPSSYGIGTFGKEAYNFIDFLSKSSQKYWQVLPLGPTSYGDSPYQTFSVFAGNPYFIDLDFLINDGLLSKDEILDTILTNENNSSYVDYKKIYEERFIILRKAYQKFSNKKNEKFNEFVNENYDWLCDYALFMSIKKMHNERSWDTWEKPFKMRDENCLREYKEQNKEEVEFWYFVQFKFYEQWIALKKYANSKKIKIIGDMPIYVAYDSSDVWSLPQNWLLDDNLLPKVVAGCPPDYFSETGQLWGNPIYNYDLMKKDGYSWWIKRIKKSFELFDTVRIDHFRGFEAYYSIPYGKKNAKYGTWQKGPGIALFNKIKDELGPLDIIAEDLGFMTKEVRKLLLDTNFPGMKVMQFGFVLDEDSEHLPHNYSKKTVAYPGTHDNRTLKEWLESISKEEKEFCYEYANINSDNEAVNKLIKCVLASASDTVIIPLWDYLELGKEARFNVPSTLGGNWSWRFLKEDLSDELSKRIQKNTLTYKR